MASEASPSGNSTFTSSFSEFLFGHWCRFAFWIMKMTMFLMQNNYQIFKAVIIPYPIKMVNILSGKQGASKILLHNKAGAFCARLFSIWRINPNISLAVNNFWLRRFSHQLNCHSSFTIALLASWRHFIFNATTFWANISSGFLAVRFTPANLTNFFGMATDTNGGFSQFAFTTTRTKIIDMLGATARAYFLSQRTAGATTDDTFI